MAINAATTFGAATCGGALLARDAWLSDVCNLNAFRVANDEALTGERAVERLRQRLADCRASFCFAKVDAAQVRTCHVLERAGFRVVDVNITLSRDTGQRLPAADSEQVEVQPAEQDETERLCRIAAESFRFSRFHLDPRFPNPLADRIKSEWVASYMAGRRGDLIWSARRQGRPIGFLAALLSPTAEAVLDLIGVDPGSQGAGVGSALVRRFVEHYQEAGSPREPSPQTLLVGTQAANIPSLRLYHRYGFAPRRSSYVFHYHADSRPHS